MSLIFDLIKGATFTSSNNNDLILDFFAGSATTAHAVMKLNAEDSGNRKYIMVQTPEELDPNKKEQKPTYDFLKSLKLPTTIAEIGKERIRRAGKKIKEENPETSKDLDIGFRVYKVGE
jgi:adenine-specific DNA-methyltransferase